jgi:azurin
LKNSKILKITAVIVCSFSLVACGAKPDATVKNFFASAQKADIVSMANYISKDTNKESFKYTEADQEKIVKSVLSKLSYEIVSSSVTGKNAVVKTKVTSIDLPKIYGKLITDMLPTLFTQALAGKEAEAQAQIMTAFTNSINDPNVAKTTTDVDIKLIKNDKGWVIETNDDLQNALTGNMAKAFASDPSKPAATDVKADPKVYSINEEAKIGRAAITVTKFELSAGKEYDAPKDGYVFAVVTLKKRNTSKDNISYGADEFKMQNDKGQIIDPSYTAIGKVLGSGQLAGDGEADGTITFEVPKESANLTFMFYANDEALLKFKVK